LFLCNAALSNRSLQKSNFCANPGDDHRAVQPTLENRRGDATARSQRVRGARRFPSATSAAQGAGRFEK